MGHTIFYLQLASYSLLTLSIFVTFASEMKGRLRDAQKWLEMRLDGGRKLIFRSKNSGNSCAPSATSSGKSWAWISEWTGSRTVTVTPLLIAVVSGVSLTAVFAMTVSTWLMLNRFDSAGLVEKTNVQVLWRAGNQFCMRDRKGEFSVRPCAPEWPSDIVSGATLPTLNYRYDEHLNCNIWANKRDEGYTAWRNSNDQPILNNFARPASTGCANPDTNRTSETTTAEARPER